MALQLQTAVRNAMLDAFESTISTAPILEIRTGAQPSATTDASTGTLLAQMTLPSDWMAAASGGSKALSGTWSDTSANASGTAAHFRLFDSGGTTCRAQGDITATGGGGTMTLDTVTVVAGQTMTITAFTLTMSGA